MKVFVYCLSIFWDEGWDKYTHILISIKALIVDFFDYQIILTVVNLPQLRGQYTCVFKGYGAALKTDGERPDMESIHCAMPTGKDLQLYPFVKGVLFGFRLNSFINVKKTT